MIYTVARNLPGTLSTMPAPDGDLDAVLADLRDRGVDTLVSLLPPDQAAALDLSDESAAAARAGLAFRSLPIPDFGVPDHAEFAEPLRELTGELDQGRHVAIHCWGGVGRSSLLAAALLVLRRETPDAAWRRIALARGLPVPETDEQRRWVDKLV
jgi:protein-tyrosine phosphatase